MEPRGRRPEQINCLTDFLTASLCIDFTNDQVLYLGTGDANYYGSRDYGIWKSTDGGTSWTPSCAGIGNRVALEILMNPADHNVLLAATDDRHLEIHQWRS
jgi:hypothetical protein